MVAILSIALGIGANAFMFSMADALVLRPLPVPRAAWVMNLRSQLRGQGPSGMSYSDFTDFRARSQSFEGLAATELNQFGFAPNKQVQPEMRAGMLVSGNVFMFCMSHPNWAADSGRTKTRFPGVMRWR